jgi:hypothetical protein
LCCPRCVCKCVFACFVFFLPPFPVFCIGLCVCLSCSILHLLACSSLQSPFAAMPSSAKSPSSTMQSLDLNVLAQSLNVLAQITECPCSIIVHPWHTIEAPSNRLGSARIMEFPQIDSDRHYLVSTPCCIPISNVF